ncbi:WD40 repeat domain-containing protein [Oligoflexus tunisiensis]|uniref:WD40 repeat domain-containing protein n=1 Tax=Oligoflexus tunisiensis TaxID=708132 RepID=UPI001C40610C|nr:hypothetical protein [Oligoflexus tunisiensis]
MKQARIDAKSELVVSSSENGQIDIWNLRDGGMQHRSIAAHEGQILDLRLDEKGESVLTAGADQSAKLWNVWTGDLKTKLDHESAVSNALFLKNSPYIVTGSGDHTITDDRRDVREIRLWDMTGQLLASDRSFSGAVRDIDEHPSLNLIAVLEKKLHVYRVDAPGSLIKLAEFNGEFLHSVKWLNQIESQSEPELVVSDGNAISLLRLKNTHLHLIFSNKVETTIRNIEVSLGASLIGVGDHNGNLKLFARDGSLKFSRNFGTHAMASLAFDSKGSRLAFSIGSGKFALLDVNRGTIQTLNAHSSAVKSLQFTEDGRLLSADETGYIRLWSFNQEQLLRDACRFIRTSLSTLAAYQNLCEAEYLE